MPKLQKQIFILFFLCCAFTLKAQHNFTIKGSITSSIGKPISFCHIVLKNNMAKGVLSDYTGNFSIDVTENDTLLIKYIGYKNKLIYVNNFDNKPIKLEQETLQLQEFTITNTKNDLSAKKIMKLAIKNNVKNYFSYNKDTQYVKKIKTIIEIKNNNKDVYLFKKGIDLFLVNNRLYIDKKYKKYKTQNIVFTESFINLYGASPYSFIPNLYSKLNIDSKYNFELGEINYYQGVEVYQVKYHRPMGNGICESAGIYFISKKNYDILYVESITTECVGIDIDIEKLNWKYGIVKKFYKKNQENLYDIYKIECETNYDYELNSVLNFFYHKNILIVESTTTTKNLNLNNLIYAKDFFIKK